MSRNGPGEVLRFDQIVDLYFGVRMIMQKLIVFAVLAAVYFFACGTFMYPLLGHDGSIGGGILGAILLLKFVYPKF